jgi:hypothetical protein
MSENTRELMSRLDRLERENRRIKRVGGSLLAAIGLVGIVGFAAPKVCDTVWAERFVLKDSRGNQRMVLNAYSTKTPAITFNDASGKGVAALQIEQSGEMSLKVFKKAGQSEASFSFTPDNLNSIKAASNADADRSIN